MRRRGPNFNRFVLNCVGSQNTGMDWGFGDAVGAQLAISDGNNGQQDQQTVLTTQPPKSKDLRRAWWAIADQGKTGACVGFATADGVLRWHYIKNGLLPETQRPSSRFIWMANKETDDITRYPTTFLESAGTSTKLALGIAQKFGCVPEYMLPMTGKLSPLKASIFFAIAAQFRITAYYNLGKGNDQLAQWRAWIANVGPILTRLDVDDTWKQATATMGHLDQRRGQTHGGHAVCLVGYTPRHFIVRNSWGLSWGDQGFAYASNSYAAESFTEAYGVIM